ncbi:MAG: hypothetical protein WCD80_07500 [Desulfobaccales bacterium]
MEVVLLHETHSVLSEIIGHELYSIGGTPPNQSVLFHTNSSFNLFLILLVEFFAEGPQSAFIDQKFQNWSLLSGLHWFCDNYPDESGNTGLDTAVSNLEGWVAKKVTFRFWCPGVNTEVQFVLTNEQLISFGANTTKHHLIRLSVLLGKIEILCTQAGYSFSPQEMCSVLASMIEEVRRRLLYHSSNILELLGNAFLSLNAIIKARFAANPTNHVNEMTMPRGITSDVFRDLYGSLLVFKRYEESRIRDHTPVTMNCLKMHYEK